MHTSWRRERRRRKGLANYRLVRCADLSRCRDKSATGSPFNRSSLGGGSPSGRDALPEIPWRVSGLVLD
jgi:hypothetical protein